MDSVTAELVSAPIDSSDDDDDNATAQKEERRGCRSLILFPFLRVATVDRSLIIQFHKRQQVPVMQFLYIFEENMYETIILRIFPCNDTL